MVHQDPSGGLIKYGDGLLKAESGGLATSTECCCLVCAEFDYAFELGMPTPVTQQDIDDAIASIKNLDVSSSGYTLAAIWSCVAKTPGSIEDVDLWFAYVCCQPQEEGGPAPTMDDQECNEGELSNAVQDWFSANYEADGGLLIEHGGIGFTFDSTDQFLKDLTDCAAGAPSVEEKTVHFRASGDECCRQAYIDAGIISA